MNKTIVLFDMDGTLTPCREKIKSPVIAALRKLNPHTRIGIVSGSDYDYIMQQCAALFDFGGVDLDNIDILPCNGTKFYKWDKTSFKLTHNNDMRMALGKDSGGASQYQKLVRRITTLQNEAVLGVLKDTTLTGTFLQYRGSLLNWCFVGRDADTSVREEFEKINRQQKVRVFYKNKLDRFLKDESMLATSALGGKTSIDIYPHGWDKTFALQYYPGWTVYFVGDACQEGGNDWHIYQALKDLGRNFDRSYWTKSPEDTVNIIDQVIERL